MADWAKEQSRRLRAFAFAFGLAGVLLLVSGAAALGADGSTPGGPLESSISGDRESSRGSGTAGPVDTLTDVVDSSAPEPAAALVTIGTTVAAGLPSVVEPAKPVADKVAEVGAPVIRSASENAPPVVDPLIDLAEPIGREAGLVVEPVVETAAPFLDPVIDVVEPAIAPITDVVNPITDVVNPIVEPILLIVEPVVDPVLPIVDPIVVPVGRIDPVGDIVLPVSIPSTEARVPGPVAGAPGSADALLPRATTNGAERVVDRVFVVRATPVRSGVPADLGPAGPWWPSGPWPANLPSGALHALTSLAGGIAMALLAMAVLGLRSGGSISVRTLVIPLRGRSPVPVVPPA